MPQSFLDHGVIIWAGRVAVSRLGSLSMIWKPEGSRVLLLSTWTVIMLNGSIVALVQCRLAFTVRGLSHCWAWEYFFLQKPLISATLVLINSFNLHLLVIPHWHILKAWALSRLREVRRGGSMGYLGEGLLFLHPLNPSPSLAGTPTTIAAPLVRSHRHPRLQHFVFFFEHFHLFDVIAF